MAKPTVDTTSTSPPLLPLRSIKSENNPPKPQMKDEPQDPPHYSSPPPPSHFPPPFLDKITELSTLSTVLSAFHHAYHDLHHHLDFLQSSINSHLSQIPIVPPPAPLAIAPNSPKLQENTKNSPPHLCSTQTQNPNSTPPPNLTETQNPSSTPLPDLTETQNPNLTPPPLQELEDTKNSNLPIIPKSENSVQNPNKMRSPNSEVEILCQKMCHKGLKRYLTSHLLNPHKLRREVPKALIFASNPAKLVLDVVGRFFLMCRKAFEKDKHMTNSSEVSVLILECFLLFGCGEIEGKIKEAAEVSAIAWKNRIVKEGGLDKANEMDARGLLLLIVCFGIPSMFSNEDIGNLIKAGNAREVSRALRKSSVLSDRIPGIIKEMILNRMEVEAVDTAYMFAVSDRLSPHKILNSFLKECEETCKRTRESAEGSLTRVNRANRKELAALKSVDKCLKDHSVDPSKLLPEWNFNDRIRNLEKEIADIRTKTEEKLSPKRKVDDFTKDQKTKASNQLETRENKHPRVCGFVENKSHIDGLNPMNMFNGGPPIHTNGYAPFPYGLNGPGTFPLPENIAGPYSAFPSALHGPSAVPFPENILGPVSGVFPAVGPSGILSRGSSTGVVQMINHDGHPHGWHGEAALHERLVAHDFAGQPALDEQLVARNFPGQLDSDERLASRNFPGKPASDEQFVSRNFPGQLDSDDRVVTHKFAGQPSPYGVRSSYRTPSSLEGFPRLPNHSSVGAPNRASGYNLYQFADML